MEEVRVKSWEAFETKLDRLRAASERPRYLLFRGHSNASWPLRTTLERSTNYSPKIIDYYGVISEIEPQVETFTGLRWDTDAMARYAIFIPGEESESVSMALAFGKLPAYSYLVYLRHHGFPSPLLDWSGSPYVTAYFAFHSPSLTDRSIYVYAEMDAGAKNRSSRQPEIYSFGPNIRSHRRHFLQQSQYTICIRLQQDLAIGQKEWRFAPHDNVFNRNTESQDVLTKFVIPAGERIKVLKKLEEYNLNALSLFGSEESLLETLAVRHFDFK
jgi:hypothetical protein